MNLPKLRNPVIEIPELLKSVENFAVFEGTAPNKLEQFIQDLSYNIDKYEAGDLILDKGEGVDYFGIIISGEVNKESSSKTEALKGGDQIGLIEIASRKNEIASKYSAKTDCVVLWTRLKHFIQVSGFVMNNDYNPFIENLFKCCADEAISDN